MRGSGDGGGGDGGSGGEEEEEVHVQCTCSNGGVEMRDTCMKCTVSIVSIAMVLVSDV